MTNTILIPIIAVRRNKDAQLMHAENCFVAAVGDHAEAEYFMWIWLLRWAGAPA